ncbi:MAG: 1-acyl-sn-glycerol-3-phosphate acyltransferase [Alphaproteobacteria bacterium]|nr:1-acyl-sn-glycerol-3-phosphate acyltransferase [Alphaproteobacteria bacterium]
MGSPTLRLARLAIYFAWTLALMPVQLLGLVLGCTWTSTLPVFYHRWCCWILGFRIRVIGKPTSKRPVLYAANHISYTDITVLGSVIPGSFIAKSEIARWPFFGWLAKLQRSVFVDRQVRSTAAQRDAIGKRLAAGDALILFPEATSGDGNRVLPFKSALFAAAQQGAGVPQVTVQPVSLAYTRLDGIPIGRLYRPFFAWYGSVELAPHLWSMVGLGAVEAVIEFHPSTFLRDCGSRKALADYCYARVAGGVAAALSGRPQPMPEPPGPTPRYAYRAQSFEAIPEAAAG